MKTPTRPAAIAALSLALAAAGHAQSVCSSDRQAPPAALLERFINADCEGCWTDLHAPQPGRGEAVLDWIVPGSRGDEAPLAAAARVDGLSRLQALGLPVPRNDASRRGRRAGRPVTVRVARGLPFNGYMGASIELRDAGPGPWRAWLVLVEALPAGTERTPVARQLVRNVLELSWERAPRGRRRFESRPMNIPAGADPDRLQVLGVVEDARGLIRGIAQSRCAPPGGKG